MPLSRYLLRTRLARATLLALALALVCSASPGSADERGFPYDKELLLDVKPMKGSKRVPILGIGSKGEAATIDLWCNTVAAQLVVAANTITIVTGAKTDKQCDAARMKGDDDLLAALQEVTTWHREGPLLTLSGGATLRFVATTN